MRRFGNICISHRRDWDTLSTLREKLSRLEGENKKLREELTAYETGCVQKGAYCKACQNGREVCRNGWWEPEYVCILNVPCGEFAAKAASEGGA